MREYVEKMLHTRVEHEPVAISGLPLYLRGLYSLERWTVFGVPLALASPLESQTVKTMAKHRDALEAALGVPVAFALEGATSYRIGRMLETGPPFVEQGGGCNKSPANHFWRHPHDYPGGCLPLY